MATCTYNPGISGSNPYAVLEVNQSSQNISENKSTVSWSLKIYRPSQIVSSAQKAYSVVINGQTVSSGNTTIGGSGTKTIASGTATINHDSDGTKTLSFSFSLDFKITWSGIWIGTGSASGSMALTTIPRATTPSLSPSTVVMGNSITISLPRAAGSFTHTLYHDFYVGSWTQFASNAGTSATLNIPVSWASKIPNNVSGEGRIRCLTYNGSTLIGEKIVVFTATVPSSVVPSITDVSISEATSGIAAKFGAYVQGASKLSVSITAAGVYGSTISKYETQVESITYTGKDITTGVLYNSGNVSVKVTVTDSRGRKKTVTYTVSVLAYSSPVITAFLPQRSDSSGFSDEDEGTYLSVYLTFSISPVGNKNDKSYKVEYCKAGSAQWITAMSGSVYQMGGTFLSSSGILDIDYEYQVRLTVGDYFGSVSRTLNIGSGNTTIDFHRSGRGLSFGRVAQREGYVDSYFPIHAYAGITYDIPEISAKDFNEFETSGIFYLFGVSSALNRPFTSNGWLEVMKYSTGSYIFQRYTTINGAKYERVKSAGTWKAWVHVGSLY